MGESDAIDAENAVSPDHIETELDSVQTMIDWTREEAAGRGDPNSVFAKLNDLEERIDEMRRTLTILREVMESPGGSGLLEYDPGVEVYVKEHQTGQIETATADENGIVRDDEGRSYGDGPYSISGEADDGE